MRKSLFKSILLVLITFFVGASCDVSAAELKLPQVVRPGDLFVVNLVPDQQVDKQVSFKIDTKQLQFMGAQQGTPDIQIKSDAEFEIKPESGSLAARYDLLFQSLSSGSAVINYQDSRGEHNLTVVFTPLDASRGYSWLILAVGVVLLIVGVKLWRYQKSAPEMMSTKSLFMNYEELEKARKMYFPEESADAKPAPPTTVPDSAPAVPAASAAAKSPAIVEGPKSSSGSSTSKQQAVKPVNVASRLAQFIDNDEEPSAKPLKMPTQTTSPVADKTMPTSPAAVKANSTQPAAPVISDESTVPVMHTTPAGESTVPAAAAVPVSEEPVDANKTIPSQKSAQAPAVEPPRPKLGIAPVEAELRKDTGERVVRNKMVFAIEDEKGCPYEAESEIIKIGRRKDCQIVLTASEISREHIEVLMEKGKICVRPLTTSNICRLNGNELKKSTPVKPGDKLNMGGTEFLVTKARPTLPV
ncbi:MAG: hypothetical protein GQF41_0319 [Candidatus Rifleibacterium amylolyticum]|nr:MAG: hypothetical protein GQF41_0319 [Candidatus Rifleibacterium amylolyticum]